MLIPIGLLPQRIVERLNTAGSKHLLQTVELCEGDPTPAISDDMFQAYLGFVHNFTAMNLDAQAFGYSVGENGVVRFLALLPQDNAKGCVSCKNGPGVPTEKDAKLYFVDCDPSVKPEDLVLRCWIRSRPMDTAGLSSEDILQLFHFTKQNRDMFAVVISPRLEGVKAICVRLTQNGYEEIER